jgi:chloramphenicol 3-O-phosphotransferase
VSTRNRALYAGCLYCDVVAIQVIVLNGASSSGKSGIRRCLQAILPDPWLAFGVDKAVHKGVAYDLQVDTTHAEALECARAIAARVH